MVLESLYSDGANVVYCDEYTRFRPYLIVYCKLILLLTMVSLLASRMTMLSFLFDPHANVSLS